VGKLTGAEDRAGVRDGTSVGRPVTVGVGDGGGGVVSGEEQAAMTATAAVVISRPHVFIGFIAGPPEMINRHTPLTSLPRSRPRACRCSSIARQGLRGKNSAGEVV
jgi:hypothetical protein